MKEEHYNALAALAPNSKYPQHTTQLSQGRASSAQFENLYLHSQLQTFQIQSLFYELQ